MKRPPTPQERRLYIDNCKREKNAATNPPRRPTVSKAVSDPERVRLRSVLNSLDKKYGWLVSQCVATILRQGVIQEAKMLWFQRKDASNGYFVEEDVEQGLDEFYILGALEGSNEVCQFSLGVLRLRGTLPFEFESAATYEKPTLINSSRGYIIRLLASEPESVHSSVDFQKANHIEEVLRKKSLHCDAVEWSNPQIPIFGVLRPHGYEAANAIVNNMDNVSDNEEAWKAAFRTISSTRDTPWSLLNQCNDEEIQTIRNNAPGKKPITINDHVKLDIEKLPYSTSVLKTTTWWAAEQSQRSVSIPTANMYEPVVIEGDQGGYFDLFRVR